ncbi:MAG: amidohydrolase family protein [Pseudomonadota bacterium]
MTSDPSPTEAAPLCAAPHPEPRAATFDVPPGAVDTHAHVIGLPPDYPLAQNRSYTPVEATPGMYLGMLDALGMTYGVLIQVSVHGTDNRRMVETLRANPDRLRGIAVVDPDVPDAELDELAVAGVRGLRLNVLFGGGVGLDAMTRLGPRCAERGWHLQLLMDARTLPEMENTIRALPVPVVVDHMGHMPVSAGVGDPGFQSLLGLMRDGRAWVKLSGAFRVSDAGPPYADTASLATALIEANADQCVWGSDWPHVGLSDMPFNTGDLLDLLGHWVPDADLRHRVLVDNPGRLYGFPPAA